MRIQNLSIVLAALCTILIIPKGRAATSDDEARAWVRPAVPEWNDDEEEIAPHTGRRGHETDLFEESSGINVLDAGESGFNEGRAVEAVASAIERENELFWQWRERYPDSVDRLEYFRWKESLASEELSSSSEDGKGGGRRSQDLSQTLPFAERAFPKFSRHSFSSVSSRLVV